MTKKEDLHIAILKYGKDKLESGVTFLDLCAHIEGQGYQVSESRMKVYLSDSYDTLERHRDSHNLNLRQGIINSAIANGEMFSLTVESTFRLIEYEEFKSANESSVVATGFATKALVVSICALIVSIVATGYSICSSGKPTTINHGQLDRLLQLEFDASGINLRLEELIEFQKSQQQAQSKIKQ